MIQSMTGFGEAQREENGHAFHIDVRSVNNRYFKASIRLPEDYGFLEADLEKLMRNRLTRGSATLRLYLRDLSAAAAQEINVPAVQRYVEQLQQAAGESKNYTTAIDLATLATLPGVCQPRELTEEQREHGSSVILELAAQAIDHLVAMRTTEGKALAEDLRGHCAFINEHLTAVREHVPHMLTSYRERLTTRVEELIAGSNVRLAEEDLLREVSIYAERSDVNEELSRLTSHLQQFDSAIDGSEPAGRKLDFITQEMLREANTIGSKAGDADVARHVIEIKGAIDRVKEQVQNVV